MCCLNLLKPVCGDLSMYSLHFIHYDGVDFLYRLWDFMIFLMHFGMAPSENTFCSACAGPCFFFEGSWAMASHSVPDPGPWASGVGNMKDVVFTRKKRRINIVPVGHEKNEAFDLYYQTEPDIPSCGWIKVDRDSVVARTIIAKLMETESTKTVQLPKYMVQSAPFEKYLEQPEELVWIVLKNHLGNPLRMASLENKKVGLRMIIRAKERESQSHSRTIRIGDWVVPNSDSD